MNYTKQNQTKMMKNLFMRLCFLLAVFLMVIVCTIYVSADNTSNCAGFEPAVIWCDDCKATTSWTDYVAWGSNEINSDGTNFVSSGSGAQGIYLDSQFTPDNDIYCFRTYVSFTSTGVYQYGSTNGNVFSGAQSYGGFFYNQAGDDTQMGVFGNYLNSDEGWSTGTVYKLEHEYSPTYGAVYVDDILILNNSASGTHDISSLVDWGLRTDASGSTWYNITIWQGDCIVEPDRPSISISSITSEGYTSDPYITLDTSPQVTVTTVVTSNCSWSLDQSAYTSCGTLNSTHQCDITGLDYGIDYAWINCVDSYNASDSTEERMRFAVKGTQNVSGLGTWFTNDDVNLSGTTNYGWGGYTMTLDGTVTTGVVGTINEAHKYPANVQSVSNYNIVDTGATVCAVYNVTSYIDEDRAFSAGSAFNLALQWNAVGCTTGKWSTLTRQTDNAWKCVSSTTSISLGTPTFVCNVLNEGNNISVYVNGVLENTLAVGALQAPGFYTQNLINHAPVTTADEVSVWSVPLSGSKIEEIYTNLESGFRSYETFNYSSWFDPDYNYRDSYNCSSLGAGEPFVINGSDGFEINGNQQIVWTTCDRPTMYVYYNNETDYIVTDGLYQIAHEVESGDSSSHNPDDVWSGDEYLTVHHMNNLTDSAESFTLTNSGASQVSYGDMDGAYEASGSDYLLVHPTHGTDYTIEFSFNTSSTAGFGSAGWDPANAWGVGSVEWYYAVGDPTGQFYVFFSDSSYLLLSTPDVLLDNDWNYITLTIDSTNKLHKFYHNGVLLATSASWGAKTARTSMADWLLHGYSSSRSDGLFDESRMYDEVRTAIEVNATYQNYLNTESFGSYVETEAQPVSGGIVNITQINCSGQSSQPFGTNDTTPTCYWDTDYAATCGMSNVNGSYNEASTTGTTSHIGTINTTQELGLGTQYVYINCTNAAGSATFKYEMYIGSCACKTSGIWNINCYDKCTISDSCAMDGNDLIINQSTTGTYNLFIQNNITGYGDVTIKGYDSSNKCNVVCESGGCIN